MPSEIDWSKYELIVGKRADHYLPRFRKFAQGGWISWNWAAFAATFAWLRYRKLWGWSWLYLFVSTPFLLVYLALPLARDSCLAALEQPSGEVASWLLQSLLALGWIIPPLIADRIYFGHVRKLVAGANRTIAEGRDASPEIAKRGGTYGVWGALAFQVLVALVAAVAIPGYGGAYVGRARVSEGVALASGAKTPLQEYVNDHDGRLPARIEDVAGTTSSKFVRNIELKPDGTIRAIFADTAGPLAGRSVLIVPTWKNREVVAWTCRSDDLPDKCLPSACRRDSR